MNVPKSLALLFVFAATISCDKQDASASKGSINGNSQMVQPDPKPNLVVVAEPEIHEPKHLFVLAGQFNMSANLYNHFAQAVRKTIGKDKVTSVRSVNEEAKMAEWDEGYGKLMKDIGNGLVGNSYETVSLIWMHGESDARSPSARYYKENFLAFVDRLRTDLKAPELKFVVGRISDTGMSDSNGPYVKMVRESQVSAADGDDDGAWIDTDDLIRMGRDGDGIRYGRNAAAILGERFAYKAMTQLGFTSEELNPNMSIGQPQ